MSTNCTDICAVDRKRLILVVGSISIVSATACVLMISAMIFLRSYRDVRQRFVMNLFISNFFQVVPVAFCLMYYDDPPIKGNIGCMIQGWTTTFGTNAAALWSANIALFLALVIFNANPGEKYEIASQLIWAITIFIPTLGIIITAPAIFFVPIDNKYTCWISADYPELRILLEYGICLAVLLFLLIIYTSMGIYLCRKKNINKSSARIGRLAGFPVVFCLLYLPLSIVRFMNSMGVSPPLIVEDIAKGLLVCDGLFNTILYGYTRNIFLKLYMKLNNIQPLEINSSLSLGDKLGGASVEE